MNRKNICSHCLERIPHSAWICPACGGWVADVTRFVASGSPKETSAI